MTDKTTQSHADEHKTKNEKNFEMVMVMVLPFDWKRVGLLLHLIVALCRSETTAQLNTSLQPCDLSSYELSQLGPVDVLEPCIVAHVIPNSHSLADTLITMVQVTPSGCSNHRDGVVTGVETLNQDNNGTGIQIGFNEDHSVQFQLISIVGGNPSNVGADEYQTQHKALLDSVLISQSVQYIVGSCSFASSVEKTVALQHQTILMAQVGPPGYYSDNNPYVFGFHLNSDSYPIPALRTLSFSLDGKKIPYAQQDVKIIYRTKSEFFYSTCRSAIAFAENLGFNLTEVGYDPDGDHNGDGRTNAYDEEFLTDLADQICPPLELEAPSASQPAIFACVLVEQDVLIRRWRENGCRPSLIWMTPSTWGWASNNQDAVPYYQGGGQWHEAFDYKDSYFESGKQLLEYNREKFGYTGTYDTVVGYAIAVLFSQHLISSYRISDFPQVEADFTSEDGYEKLRRDLLVLNANTLFGPFSLNEFQRNAGRGAAGTQWQPVDSSDISLGYASRCISPFLQAEASTVVPAPTAKDCPAGSSVSFESIQNSSSLLQNKCQLCPVDTYSIQLNSDLQCSVCPIGSSTLGEEGASACTAYSPNLLPSGIKAMGFCFVGITWTVSATLMTWLMRNRDNPVIRSSQMPLLLICVGTIISSSSIIVLTFAEADVGESTAAADVSCQSLPFFYAIGWILQYSPLFITSFHLYTLTKAQKLQSVATTTATTTTKFIALFVLMDLIVLVVWTAVKPLVYERQVTGTDISTTNGLITVSSSGRCSNGSAADAWPYVGPLALVHLSLMLVTNFFLWTTRKVPDDRYKEHKSVAFASLFVGEILMVGLSVFLAVGDNNAAQYIVLSGIIFLNGLGILAFVFLPKTHFVKESKPEGVLEAVSGGATTPPSMSCFGFFRRQTSRANSGPQASIPSGADPEGGITP